jgi:hypothetical protein
MNIKKYMKEHESEIKERLLDGEKPNWNDLKEKHARMIRYMQHERLIHLLVTLAFGGFFLISMVIVLTTPCVETFILAGLFLFLLVPYLSHYFFLENTIQRWYKWMDEIEERQRTEQEKR